MKKIILLSIVFLILNAAFAQTAIEPAAYQFEPQQTGYSSQTQSFEITNTGNNTIEVQPEDIYLTGQNAQTTDFSILTYNLWHDNQNWPARLERMLPEIEELNPDLIGLQEVIQRPDLENQAQTIADSLGYHYYFSSVDSPGSSTRFGNAILSKHPVEETDWTALEPLDDYRNAARMNIVVDGHSIDFYTTHLHNVAVNSDIREEQINDLLSFIEETRTGDYVFVSGDYNADPDWGEMEIMYEDYQDVYPLFHENHLDPEHGTLNHHLGHIQRRIDYIFYKKDTEPSLEPLMAEVVLDTANQEGVYGSDHFGVFASFTLLSDTEDFVLENISEPIELQSGESTEVGVAFAPVTTGNKAVYLHAQEAEAEISGEAYDATVHSFPWQEHFSEEDFPLGWETASENWRLDNTNEAGGEIPEAVFSQQEESTEDQYTLYSPPFNTAQLDSMELSLHHNINNPDDNQGSHLKLVSIANGEQHLIAEWEEPASIPAEELNYTLFSHLHGIGAESLRLAWIFEGDPSGFGSWHIDDISLEALPALHVSPKDYDFGNHEINSQSDEKMFELSNTGGGSLLLSPSEISITGNNADAFTLNNLENSIELENEEVASVGVTFFPQSEGEKSANLIIKDDTVHLTGNAYDATISALPWTEEFENMVGNDIPLGWERDSENWGAFNASNAGGEAPEMTFWWQPETEGAFYLSTPDFELGNTDTLVLSFKHRVRNFGNPGNYTLKVVTIADDNETLITEWVDPATIEAQEVSFILDAENHNTDAESFRLAWIFEGPTDNITQWDIDDIMLYAPTDTIVPEIAPESHQFEDTPIEEESESEGFQIKNLGGMPWNLHPDDITLQGPDADQFDLENIAEETILELNETAEVSVSFQPNSVGTKNATLVIGNNEVSLSGNAVSGEGYFVYSDFSVTEDGLDYTNVGGFREVPAFAQNGSLEATDIAGEGEYGDTVLELDYDLSMAEDFTVYYMWAYPIIDLSDYSTLVIRIKSEVSIQNLKIAIQDADGVSEEDGAGYTYIDVTKNWETLILPVEDFQTESWAENLPDLSQFQKIDLIMETSEMTPQAGKLWVDMVGFTDSGVSVPENDNNKDNNLSVYPNPASEKVNIETSGKVTITLRDITGKTILKEKSSGKKELDISGLKKGIYLIQSDSEHQSSIKKLVIH